MHKKTRINISLIFFQIICLCLIIIGSDCSVFAFSLNFRDSLGHDISLTKKPERVVSLVPGITEMIIKIGAADSLKGITYHSAEIPGASGIEIMGGFFSPDIARIEKTKPDLVFYASLQKEVRDSLSDMGFPLINLEPSSIQDSYDHILLLGKIFGRLENAEEIVREIKGELDIIHKKVKRIPPEDRKRVIRIMGLDKDTLLIPGDDSFQNEMISAAGGIPPPLEKNGQAVRMTLEEWRNFNPQVIYTCGDHTEDILSFLDQSGWRDVEAFQSGRILNFPCDLTCRAATKTGFFVSWLSTSIYHENFADEKAQVIRDGITKIRPLDVPVDYVKAVSIFYSSIRDFPNKSLVVDFNRPLSILSSLEGFRQGIKSVVNHYSPPPNWILDHNTDLSGLRAHVLRVISRPEEMTSTLFTGADMDHLSVQHAHYKEMHAWALVTAGVQSNAVRMSMDRGDYYGPGTINIILLTNMRLTPRAMTRAIISATEAKTAALQDIDIRSSYSPLINQATGTGTDNIIVVEGDGVECDQTGGHCKMGELIASAVYQGVKEAVRKQNGIISRRDIFQRLMERKISIPGLVSSAECGCGMEKEDLSRAIESILIKPEYAAFITASFALSDDYEKGLLVDLESYRLWCKTVAEKIAQKEIEEIAEYMDSHDVPVIIRMSLNAIITGASQKGK